jgi:hypothetical protein
MKVNRYVPLLLVALAVFSANVSPLFAEDCPADHCSINQKKIYAACKKSGNVGAAYYDNPKDPSGPMCSCPCSCYAEGTEILSLGKTVSVESVNQGDTLSTPAGEVPVQKPLRSTVENFPAVQLELANGKSLTVSTNHPFITEGGIVAEARDIKSGSSLMQENGSSVPVASATPTSYTGTFYNFILDGKHESGSDRVVFSEGVQSGDWMVQSFRQGLATNVGLREVIAKIRPSDE